jgi:zinc protease
MQKISFLNRILEYDLDKTYIKKQSNILNSITKDEVDNLAESLINKDKLQIVIVGNAYLIKKKLENLTSKDGKKYNYKITVIK